MKTINGERRYTEAEARAQVDARTREVGRNDSKDSSGLSYRREGVPGTGGGTEAWSFALPITRKGVRYYKIIPYAS